MVRVCTFFLSVLLYPPLFDVPLLFYAPTISTHGTALVAVPAIERIITIYAAADLQQTHRKSDPCFYIRCPNRCRTFHHEQPLDIDTFITKIPSWHFVRLKLLAKNKCFIGSSELVGFIYLAR